MASKYGNAKPIYKGIEFDSGLEMLRYRFLERKLKAGQITELRRQVRYPLIPAQFKHPFYITNGNGKKMPEPGKEGAVSYIADFVYKRNGVEVVEDAKGVRTDVYIIKRKLMLYFHGITIYEVENPAAPLGGGAKKDE